MVVPVLVSVSILETIKNTSQHLSQSQVKIQNINNLPNDNNSINIIGTYGQDQLMLTEWNNVCYILIPGRYNPNTITSTAVWNPQMPNSLLILSRVTQLENVFKFFKWARTTNDTQTIRSKSYLYFNNDLVPLDLLSINGVYQPVYFYTQNKPMTKDLLENENFVGQFYDYNQNGYNGLTSIEFGLNGFTDALEAYNNNCNGSN